MFLESHFFADVIPRANYMIKKIKLIKNLKKCKVDKYFAPPNNYIAQDLKCFIESIGFTYLFLGSILFNLP